MPLYTIFADFCVFAATAKSHQSCPTLCDPMDCSLPGSSSMGLPRQEYWSGSLFSVYSSLILIFFILSSLVFFHSSI